MRKSRSVRRLLCGLVAAGVMLVAVGPAAASSAPRQLLHQERWLVTAGAHPDTRVDSWQPRPPTWRSSVRGGQARAVSDTDGVELVGSLSGALDVITIDLHVASALDAAAAGQQGHSYVAQLVVDGRTVYRSTADEHSWLVPGQPGQVGRLLRLAFTDIQVDGDRSTVHNVAMSVAPAGVQDAGVYLWGTPDSPSRLTANPKSVDAGLGGYAVLASQN